MVRCAAENWRKGILAKSIKLQFRGTAVEVARYRVSRPPKHLDIPERPQLLPRTGAVALGTTRESETAHSYGLVDRAPQGTDLRIYTENV